MDARSRLVEPIRTRYRAEVAATPAANEIELRLEAADLARAAADAVAERAHLLALWAHDETDGGALVVRVALAVEGEDLLLVLAAALDRERPELPSLAARHPWAIGPERELAELFGIHLPGLPDRRPLLLHAPPAGLPPLRRGAEPGRLADRVAPHPSTAVEGEGVSVLELGPLGMGGVESIEHRIARLGERVIHVETRAGWKHRGAEHLGRGRRPEHLVALAERLCGGCAAAHAAAASLAIERLAGFELPRRAGWLRAALIEMERLATHAGSLAAILDATGLYGAAAAARRAGEAVRAEIEQDFGSRRARGFVVPGGVLRDLAPEPARTLARRLRGVSAELRAATEAALETPAFAARLEQAGALLTELAVELDLVGPVARASGSRRDVRRDHPSLAWAEVGFWVPLYGSGDALARFRLLAEEAQQSAALAEEALANLPDGPVRATVGPLPPGGRGLGLVESPRGALLHAVHAGAGGEIDRWHVHPPSLTNWPALGLVLPGAGLDDVPLVRASFALCAACADR